ncbi:hypothetical protein KY338_01570 [Candidatus Woesearchaeota archaeon]|nr:hypothetical protein [Candidatus Woesearchaeota archaeon]MBW3005602.1 hypothetical protein [Candidatus Woesearchaeota archaeon]
MQNIVRIKEVLDSISSFTSEYKECKDKPHAEQLQKSITSAKKQLLDAYTPEVSDRFDFLDAKLHSLLKEHFNSLVLAIGDLQQAHETKVRSQHVDPNITHNLILTHIHPIIQQIDHRLLAMNVTLQGLSVAAKRNP